MEGQKTRKWRYLFEVELDEDELDALMGLDPSLLKNLIFRCSRIFQKQSEDRLALSTFLNNYRMIMQLHSAVFADSFSVNLCLHFALLYSQYLLLENREQQAKAILKQTEEYIEIEGIDPMLVGLCLNNLAYLYSRQGKIYKALAVALKAVSIIEDHLQELKSTRRRDQLVQDVIVFVNVLTVTQKVLLKILKTNSKTFFKSLFKVVSRLGYSFSEKYLGAESIFTKKFYLSEDSVLLPVYQEEQPQEDQPNEFEARIACELEKIYMTLKELNLQPEVFYIKEHSAKLKSKSDTSSIRIQEEVPPEPQFSVCYSQSFEMENWQAEVSIFRESTDLMIASPSYEFMGHIQFKLQQEKNVLVYKIQEDQFIKVVNCINFSDILPSEYEFKRLNPTEFFRRVLLKFITISKEGQLRVTPRALPVIEPMQKSFCSREVFIFVNHLYFRKFRVAICPISTADAIYLDIQFRGKEIYSLFRLTQALVPGISQLYHNYHSCQQIQQDPVKYHPIRKIHIKDKKAFTDKIISIVDMFQHFLIDGDLMVTENLMDMDANLSDLYNTLYLYVEEKEGRGHFNELKYRANANYIELYRQNTFKTFTPTGLLEARGSAIISPQQFLKDFGVTYRTVKKWLPAFYSLIAQKYTLKIFEERIDQSEEDRYQENAILQLSFVSKFFKRKFIEFEGYMLPLTLEVISIEKETPVGLRATVYEPIKGINSGLFIYINADYWEKLPQPLNETEQRDSEYQKKPGSSFNFVKGYFLTRWLTEQGFALIFSKLTIVNRSLQMKGHPGKFVRLDEFF